MSKKLANREPWLNQKKDLTYLLQISKENIDKQFNYKQILLPLILRGEEGEGY